MTKPTSPDPSHERLGEAMAGEIAAKLTEAQQRLLCGDTRYVRWATYERLIKMGLLYQVGGFINRTELGRAVKAHLASL